MSENYRDFDYQPVRSVETGEPREVLMEYGVAIVVDTPRVGVDGLREALEKKYGSRQADSGYQSEG